MLKPLTFSLSLAVALGLCSVSMAGGHDTSCSTCGLASPQGVVASPQGVTYGGCDTCSAPKKHCFTLPKLPHFSLPKINCTTSYEWVLKKKHNFSITHGGGPRHTVWRRCTRRARAGCSFWPGRDAPSGQGYTPTTYPAPQVYGAGQHAFQAAKPAPSIASVPAELTQPTIGGEEAPPAPEVRGNSTNVPQNGGLLLPSGSGTEPKLSADCPTHSFGSTTTALASPSGGGRAVRFVAQHDSFRCRRADRSSKSGLTTDEFRSSGWRD